MQGESNNREKTVSSASSSFYYLMLMTSLFSHLNYQSFCKLLTLIVHFLVKISTFTIAQDAMLLTFTFLIYSIQKIYFFPTIKRVK